MALEDKVKLTVVRRGAPDIEVCIITPRDLAAPDVVLR